MLTFINSSTDLAEVVIDRNFTASESIDQRFRFSIPIAPSSFAYFCVLLHQLHSNVANRSNIVMVGSVWSATTLLTCYAPVSETESECWPSLTNFNLAIRLEEHGRARQRAVLQSFGGQIGKALKNLRLLATAYKTKPHFWLTCPTMAASCRSVRYAGEFTTCVMDVTTCSKIAYQVVSDSKTSSRETNLLWQTLYSISSLRFASRPANVLMATLPCRGALRVATVTNWSSLRSYPFS